MTGLFRRFIKARQGLATLEAALIFPILVALSLAASDAGMMMLTLHKLESGLSAGGAYLARSIDPASDEARAKNVAVTGFSADGNPAIVKDWSTADVTITIADVDNSGGEGELVLRGGNAIQIVRFETSYAYSGLGLLGMMNAGSITLRAKHEERLFIGDT